MLKFQQSVPNSTSTKIQILLNIIVLNHTKPNSQLSFNLFGQIEIITTKN